ncbi:MFS transporter [Lachnospiraceae bacterium 54-53]
MDRKISFISFWLGQTVSQLGSSMTAFALTIWVFEKTQTAMTVSFMSFCTWMPYILVSIFAGGMIDSHSKKAILIITHSVAAFCTISILISIHRGVLEVRQIYMVNAIAGFMNAFQSPASSVVTGFLIPKKQYARASGLLSFSGSLVMVAAPMLSGMFVAFAGLSVILFLDLLSFFIAMFSLLFIKIEEPAKQMKKNRKKQQSDLQEGFEFLKREKGILYIMVSMAAINFFSRLTYENILSPMILSRSGGDAGVYGIVSGVMGFGGVAGGLLLVAGKKEKDPLKLIYFSAGFSFLIGDLMMGAGRNLWAWSAAGLAASLPIPFIMAGQNVILYRMVPGKLQGRVFAIRNGVQYSAIPVGILLGGYLADHVFEPFMASGRKAAALLGKVVGTGSGSGMAVMFLCTGLLGTAVCFLGYKNHYIQSLKGEVSD